MASYFIGDIQGCYDELQHLLDAVNFDPNVDILYPVGDLVARGSDSLSTAKLMLSLAKLDAVRPVLGNHDLHLMALHAGLRKPKDSDKLHELLASPIIDDYIEWLRCQPLVRTGHDFVMAHAGWYPGWDLVTLIKQANKVHKKLSSGNYLKWLQVMYGNEPTKWTDDLPKRDRFRFTINACTRMRYLDAQLGLEFKAKMAIEDSPSHLTPWFNYLNTDMSKLKIIFGHWASLLGQTGHDNVLALDTGCVWGNHMTAYCLEENRYICVDSIHS